MTRKRSSAAKAKTGLGEWAGALNSFANHAILVLGCYFVATLASQLEIYFQDGHWINGVRPLYARMTNGDAAAPSSSDPLLAYVLDDVNALLLVGGAILLFGGLKLAVGVGDMSSRAGVLQPKAA